MAISGISFAGRYELNANQPLPERKNVPKRDAVIGLFTQIADRGDKIYNDMEYFYKSEKYKRNPHARLDIVLDIPDINDTQFEEIMDILGQKYNKIA